MADDREHSRAKAAARLLASSPLDSDAERIAGGEPAVAPVATRAREVAQVADALGGMAGALEHALGSSAAAESERRARDRDAP